MKIKDIAVGQIYRNKQGADCVVTAVNGSLDVRIKFLDRFGFERSIQAGSLSSGYFRNPYFPSVMGVGYVGVGRFKSGGSRSEVPEYSVWSRMLIRCYSASYQRSQPTYAGCTVHESWHNYQVFAEWLTSQPSWGRKGFELDKDLIILRNKEYGPDTCSLVPGSINCLIATRKRKNDSPLGACFNEEKQKYTAFCMDGYGKNKFLGAFISAAEAFSVYKAFKESVIKRIAEEHRHDLDPRVFSTLMNYEVLPE